MPETPQQFLANFESLEEGDILFSARETKFGPAVRFFTQSDYSHVLYHTGGGSVIHADSRGVHSENLQRMLFDSKEAAAVFRLKATDSVAIKPATHYVRSLIGTQYSFPEAILSVSKRKTSEEQKSSMQFCSRLIAQAYEIGGLNLVANADYCFPEDLLKSALLVPVPDCVRLASVEELEYANSPSPIDIQTIATNRILSVARQLLGPKVQALQDIHAALELAPHHDAALCSITEQSGYLTMWCEEMLKNPWRYNAKKFMELPISSAAKRRFAQYELNSAIEQLQRFGLMRSHFQANSQRVSLKLNQKYFELYINLHTQANVRHDTAMFVLDAIPASTAA